MQYRLLVDDLWFKAKYIAQNSNVNLINIIHFLLHILFIFIKKFNTTSLGKCGVLSSIIRYYFISLVF